VTPSSERAEFARGQLSSVTVSVGRSGVCLCGEPRLDDFRVGFNTWSSGSPVVCPRFELLSFLRFSLLVSVDHMALILLSLRVGWLLLSGSVPRLHGKIYELVSHRR